MTRTGGFAGLRREWRVEPGEAEAAHWVALIEECPWDDVAAPEPPHGADLFAWHVCARCAAAEGVAPVERDARLQDPQVEGAWRALIDAVRSSADS